MPVRKRRQKGLKVSDFAVSLPFSSDIVTVKGLKSVFTVLCGLASEKVTTVKAGKWLTYLSVTLTHVLIE